VNIRIISAVVSTVLSSACFYAHASLVTNGSFETGSFVDTDGTPATAMSLALGATDMTGWAVFGDKVTWIKEPSFGLTAPDGEYFLDLTDYQSGSPFGGVRQTIATTAGQAYRVSFQLPESVTLVFQPSYWMPNCLFQCPHSPLEFDPPAPANTISRLKGAN